MGSIVPGPGITVGARVGTGLEQYTELSHLSVHVGGTPPKDD